jgi:hypothetical protein
MKHFKTLALISALIVISGATLKVLHLKYGDTLIYIGMLAQIIVQSYHISALENKIEEKSES